MDMPQSFAESSPSTSDLIFQPQQMDQIFGSGKERGNVYICLYCQKTFHHKHDFRKHERTHTGEKPYLCPYCSYRAARNDNLKSHIVSPTAYNVQSRAKFRF